MTDRGISLNPFPGLRPFEADEDYLFFGREDEVDELLRRLRSNRFVAVVGTSGCGKSSLVRSGLIPSLNSGFMSKAGSSWRVALLRPGEDPIGRLAAALDAPGVIGAPTEELISTNRVLVEAALRRGTLGLVEAVRQSGVPRDDNLLVVIDQFEELFRFNTKGATERSRDEATVFVKLLLEAAGQQEIPIYVVLTMRADFIGECVEYEGLPEALNASQYLVPRLSRDELRAAIMGPIAAAGGTITPRLVVRLLNDLDNDQDQLPVLQHVLMRSWSHWQRHSPSHAPLDVANYEAVGSLRDALSRHAEETFEEVGSGEPQRITERIFKALTDTVTDPRGTRRPCSVSTLAAIANVSESEVTRIVDVFRGPGRSFLMPPPDVSLSSDVIVDLSHESLMRCWTRLITWTDEERVSASVYLRLSKAAVWFDEGSGGLWRDPELELALRWKGKEQPSQAWAHRYDKSFGRAMEFLARSERTRNKSRSQWRRLQGTLALLGAMLFFAVWSGFAARRSRSLAEANLLDAVRAVDESLALVARDPTQIDADHAEVVALRRDLAEKARDFYAGFIRRGYSDERLRQAVAATHFNLGHANRVLEDVKRATEEYRFAVEAFEGLARDYPESPMYRQSLANSYAFLGETLGLSVATDSDARKAYDTALSIQQQLRREHPDTGEYRRDLAHTYYNRGNLHAKAFLRGQDQSPPAEEFRLKLAESDFREAIALVEPLVRETALPSQDLQTLARAFTDLGSLLSVHVERVPEVETLFERAVGIGEVLVNHAPADRQHKLELSRSYTNLSNTQSELGRLAQARQSSQRARELLEELARPAPSLSVELADVHTLNGQALELQGWAAALPEYQQALEIFEDLDRNLQARPPLVFHERFGYLLLSLATLANDNPSVDRVRTALSRASDFYLSVCERVAKSGAPSEAKSVLETMSRVLPVLSIEERRRVLKAFMELSPSLRQRAKN